MSATGGGAPEPLGPRIDAWVAGHRGRIVDTASRLIAVPSATEPPHGSEAAVQAEIASLWRAEGAELDVFAPEDVPGLRTHPLYRPEWDGMPRPLEGRPVVVGRWPGSGGGRSILLSAHADTMPPGPLEAWSVTGPYTPRVVGGRLYGRGGYDTKGMLAVYTEVVRCLRALGWRGRGDLLVESVCDEEYGGSHGCLAARLRGHGADVAVNGEPTHMVPCISHNGGGEWKVVAGGGGGGMAFAGEDLPNPIVTLAEVALAVERWRVRREAAARAEDPARPVPGVYLAQVSAGGHRYADLFGIPPDGHLYLWIEEAPDVDAEAHAAGLRAALSGVAGAAGRARWDLRPTIRYLPGSRMAEDHPVWPALAEAYGGAGLPYRTGNAPFACDTYVFNRHSATPALTLGPGGGGAHAPDEYVLVDDLCDLVRVLARLVAAWTA